MSVNGIKTTPAGGFETLPEENILTPRHPADVELFIPATISGPKRKETAKGSIWVTDQRVVFLAGDLGGSTSAPPSYDAPPTLNSISIPYLSLLSATYHLPTFSANHMMLTFLPDVSDPNNGLPSPGRGAHIELKVIVGDGASHGVWKRIEGERQSAEGRRQEGEMLRESITVLRLKAHKQLLTRDETCSMPLVPVYVYTTT